ncbi:major facilitator superfamily transporter [Penicillium angulare]|uniref:Major facilitator superfamily transporter n=1 Tax=Penicillium angulare TaxID=116970 RepID=A0A9W9FAJ4_9EURO|nr:major facilitator superfamily transporter [Penicillium angulare]
MNDDRVEIGVENATLSPHSTFSKFEKGAYVYVASLAAFASPVSSSIYYPAMTTLAKDLNTSLTNISLTITTYMIFQGISPTIVGGFSDRYGRRPAYLLCFTVYIAANIGLALQKNYAALLVLRCVQSAGSSGTTALSNGVVSDVATRQQRGSYVGLAALGSSLGPALGPLIGGLLNHFLGWRAIFWFLSIYGGVMLLVFLILIPETCRNIVGNGSVPPQRWNKPLVSFVQQLGLDNATGDNSHETIVRKKRPGILSAIPILLEKENLLILFFGGIFYAGFYIIITGLPAQLSSTYSYNSIQVGLCYIPIGAGPLLIRPFVGRIMDANFRRHARRLGVKIDKEIQHNIDDFPIERVRLEISLAFIYFACITIIPYGWVIGMEQPPLPAILVLLFFMGLSVSAAFQPLSALVIDINTKSSAAASAANNLVRCLLGAGGVAIVNPLFDALGRGWTATLIALVWGLMSFCWWAVIKWGPRWRTNKKNKRSKKAQRALENVSATTSRYILT